MKKSPQLARLKKMLQNMLCKQVKNHGFNGIFVGEGSNLRYLTGYAGPGILELNCYNDETILYVPLLEYLIAKMYENYTVDKVVALTGGLAKPSYVNFSYEHPLPKLLQNCKKTKYSIAGISSREQSTEKCTDFTETLQKQRSTKNEFEVDIYKEAVQRTEQIIAETVDSIFSGDFRTVGDVWWFLKKRAHEVGEGTSFDPIVAVDKYSSYPHAPLNVEQLLEKAKVVLIDYGIYYNTYATDLTRIIMFSNNWRITAQLDILVNTIEIAIDYTKEGTPSWMPDSIARNLLSSVGLAEYFVHSLGHGVGSAVHELPRLSPNSKDSLQNNMVITIEPGIYLGDYGLRLESMVIVGKKASTRLDSIDFVIK